jgi:hypothetical protein
MEGLSLVCTLVTSCWSASAKAAVEWSMSQSRPSRYGVAWRSRSSRTRTRSDLADRDKSTIAIDDTVEGGRVRKAAVGKVPSPRRLREDRRSVPLREDRRSAKTEGLSLCLPILCLPIPLSLSAR